MEAARELVAMGYTNVNEYPGGKKEWIDAGFPVEGEAHGMRAEKDKAA